MKQLLYLSLLLFAACSSDKDEIVKDPIAIEVTNVTENSCELNIINKPDDYELELSTDSKSKTSYTEFESVKLSNGKIKITNLRSYYTYFGRLVTKDGQTIKFDLRTAKNLYIKRTEGKYHGAFNVIQGEIDVNLEYLNQDSIKVTQPLNSSSKESFSFVAAIKFDDALDAKIYIPRQYIKSLKSYIKGEQEPLGSLFGTDHNGRLLKNGTFAYYTVKDDNPDETVVETGNSFHGKIDGYTNF